MTLKDGLEKFNEKNQKYFSDHPMSLNGSEFLKHHDITHVVFGCDTSIYGEGIVKIWTTFGTSLSFWKVVKGYKDASAFKLAQSFSIAHFMKNILHLLITIPKAIIRAKKMTKPWPFSKYQCYLNTSLSEIRKEFNIQVIQ